MLTSADAPHSPDRLSASSLPYYVRAALSCVKTTLTSVLSPHLPDSQELIDDSSLRLLRISAGSHSHAVHLTLQPDHKQRRCVAQRMRPSRRQSVLMFATMQEGNASWFVILAIEACSPLKRMKATATAPR
jgi:hypothetical protein